MRNDILVIGYGVVGMQIFKFFENQCDILDVPKNIYPKYDVYKYAFVCVPTDNDDGERCDISNVENAIKENNAEFYIIKSTIPPKTTEMLSKKYNKKIIFSPEYYGNTKNNIGKNTHFIILGGEKNSTDRVAQLYMENTSSNFIIECCDSTTAELSKYMENSFIAAKVAFMNEFYRMAKKLGVSYLDLRKNFLLDERFSPYFTYVFDEQPFYNSHCLNKDLPALRQYMKEEYHYDTELISSIIEINKKWKNEFLNETI